MCKNAFLFYSKRVKYNSKNKFDWLTYKSFKNKFYSLVKGIYSSMVEYSSHKRNVIGSNPIKFKLNEESLLLKNQNLIKRRKYRQAPKFYSFEINYFRIFHEFIWYFLILPLTFKKFQKRLFIELYIPIMSLKILSGRNLRRIYALKKPNLALKFYSKFYNEKFY
jgi:hypothetical protein